MSVAKTLSIEIRCLHADCRKWFPCALFFRTKATFYTDMLFRHVETCPHCGKRTSPDAHNFRASFADGMRLGNHSE